MQDLFYVLILFLLTGGKGLPNVTESIESDEPRSRETPEGEPDARPVRALSSTFEVKDWWKEQMTYESDSGEDY